MLPLSIACQAVHQQQLRPPCGIGHSKLADPWLCQKATTLDQVKPPKVVLAGKNDLLRRVFFSPCGIACSQSLMAFQCWPLAALHPIKFAIVALQVLSHVWRYNISYI